MQSVEGAAKSGDTRALLEAMRDSLALAMDEAEPAVKAQISGQLTKVVAAIRELPAEKGSFVDDLAKRREDRLTKAGTSASPKRQARQRSKRSG